MSLFRDAPVRIYYGENRTAAIYDESTIAVAVAAGMLGLAWFCVWPTCKRKRNTLLINAAYAEGIFVFVVAILGLVTKSWQRGTLQTSAPYAAYSRTEINATVGLYMGLESFNVTLVGMPEYQNTSGSHGSVLERVNYNEIVPFGVRQGRNGFNEYSNTVNQSYRRMQSRGLPYPIAWVVELFTNDGDGMRWGRTHRQAGYYAHVLLWTSVPMWVLTLMALAAGLWGISGGFGTSLSSQARLQQNGGLSRTFLLKSQLRPASVLCMCTGLLQLCAPLLYAAIVAFSPGPEVRIHFSLGDLVLHYGWTFWLTLCHGAMLLLGGLAATCWCTCGYDKALRNFDFVWEDLAKEKQLQQHQLLHQTAHTGSSNGLTYGSGVSGVKHRPKHSRSANGSHSISASHEQRLIGAADAHAVHGSSQSKALGYASPDVIARSSATPEVVELAHIAVTGQQGRLPPIEYPSPVPPSVGSSSSSSASRGTPLPPILGYVASPGGQTTSLGGATAPADFPAMYPSPAQHNTPSSSQQQQQQQQLQQHGVSTPVSQRPTALGIGSVLEPIADVESEASPVSAPSERNNDGATAAATPVQEAIAATPLAGGGANAETVPAAAAVAPPVLAVGVTPTASSQLPLYSGSVMPLSSMPTTVADGRQHFVFAPAVAAEPAVAPSPEASPKSEEDTAAPAFHSE